MSRLTGSEAFGLMEAYNAVYAPQELTEEQIWEEVESWVNSLLEEGYDLSDYTWEEMYEAYIEEQGSRRGSGSSPSQTNQSVSLAPIGNALRSFGTSISQSFSAANRVPTSSSRGGRGAVATPSTKPQIGSLPPSARQVTQYPAGVPTGVGGGNAGASVQPPAKPAAPPRPGTPAPAPRPGTPGAAAKPAPAPAAAKPDTPDQIAKASVGAPPTPTGGALGVAAKPEVRAALNLPPKPAAPTPAPAPAAPAPAPKPSALAQRVAGYKAGGPVMGARERMLNQSFDLFDVIKGHLLDEGYADNEDAALAIMANMSEEWKQSIVEMSSGGAAVAKMSSGGAAVAKMSSGGGAAATQAPIAGRGASSGAGIAGRGASSGAGIAGRGASSGAGIAGRGASSGR